MHAVQPRQQLALRPRHVGGPVHVGAQVQHRRARRAEARPLERRREEARLPALHAVDRQSAWVVQHDVGGQVLVLAAQAVDDPRPQRRPARPHLARVDEVDGRLVGQVRRVHGADERQVVHHAGQVRHHLGDPGATPAVSGELERAAHQRPGVLDELDLPGDLVEVGLAVVFVERRLGVEQVHLARPAVHEQVDDRPGLRGEVRLARLEVGRPVRRRRRAAQAVLAQQVSQSRPADTAGDAVEEAPAVDERRAGGPLVVPLGHRLTPQSTYRNPAEFISAWQKVANAFRPAASRSGLPAAARCWAHFSASVFRAPTPTSLSSALGGRLRAIQ